jgi:ABC-type transport system involved in cytochrome c biogenesis permease subunit
MANSTPGGNSKGRDNDDDRAAAANSGTANSGTANRRPASSWSESGDFVNAMLAPLASLKFTVVLFAMAIFIVLAGTLGQTEADIWQIIDHYFRMPGRLDAYTDTPLAWFEAAFASIQLKIFFPKSFFPEMPEYAWLDYHFYFPKGWVIGALMFVNLIAAHVVRFRMQARGPRLVAGAIVLALGGLLTYAVVHTGALGNEVGVQDAAWLDWDAIWTLTKVSLAALWLAIAVLIIRMDPEKKVLRIGLGAAEVAFGAALVWLFTLGNDFALDESSMRILWQLIKATSAGVVLLVGCLMMFKQRAGIVLLHAGVGLMMFSELLVGLSAVESQITAQEGQSKNYSEDTREVELAVVDRSATDTDEVVVVDQRRLKREEIVSDDALPFDVKLVEYIPNSPGLRNLKPGEANPATAGVGLKAIPIAEARSVGTDTNQRVDVPAAYVELISKEVDGKSLGTYLLAVNQMSTWLETEQRPEVVTVGGKRYEVALRFKRIYRPFWIEVIDARQDNYAGTSMARNFSSDVIIHDAEGRELLKTRIWMNNPLRFEGETYYQSGFHPQGTAGLSVDATTLQVVTNKGWMIPYVSCMIVAVGMMHQFSVSLVRFVRRRARITEATLAEPDPWAIYLPVGVVAVAALWAAYTAFRPLPEYADMDIEAAGRLPVMEGGRCKPLDTVARSALRVLSKRETFIDKNEDRQPAIRWLLDVIAGAKAADEHRVFRIENPDVLDSLKLTRRKGFLYSAEEVNKGRESYRAEYRRAHEARERDPKNITVQQKQILDFDERLTAYDKLVAAFRPDRPIPALPEDATEADFERVRKELAASFREFMREAEKQRLLEVSGAPLVVPTRDEAAKVEEGENKEPWITLVGAQLEGLARRIQDLQANGKPMPVARDARHYWSDLLSAYAAQNPVRFNEAVEDYRQYLGDHAPDVYQARRVNFESFFNRAEPFYVASWLYLGVFFLAIGALLGWSRPLNRAAFCLTLFILVLHTFAIISRIYISGRPPVTTLYSSAVFIGWGGVALAAAMEGIFKLGLGNLLAGIMGSGTLLVAHFLSLDGDTFPVLVAVLDTQFWLATHVVTVTAGYAATFVAGILGFLYVILGIATPALNSHKSNVLARMIYGSLCFAIFFSFIGTVLGGLWADDSWGRFWGWDPKENGALIIVLWNALVLHARWDGWIKDRGMAVMAMVGNVVTAWSWFGVNNLDVGLHSYGKSEEMITNLLIFWVVQLLIVGVGLVPKAYWWSFRAEAELLARGESNRGDSNRAKSNRGKA